MGGQTMATNSTNDDRDTFLPFIHDKLDNIWVYMCMVNDFSGPVHYYHHHHHYHY